MERAIAIGAAGLAALALAAAVVALVLAQRVEESAAYRRLDERQGELEQQMDDLARELKDLRARTPGFTFPSPTASPGAAATGEPAAESDEEFDDLVRGVVTVTGANLEQQTGIKKCLERAREAYADARRAGRGRERRRLTRRAKEELARGLAGVLSAGQMRRLREWIGRSPEPYVRRFFL